MSQMVNFICKICLVCDMIEKKMEKSGAVEKICYVIGACEPGEIVIDGEALVIAADGGLRFLEEYGIKPDLTVGDFDSLGHVPRGENIICHPVEKDDTDTLLAVKLGLERGCGVFVLYGCLGGRIDHTFANLQTLLFIAKQGARGYLIGDGWVSCVIRDSSLQFPAGLSGTVSVFCPDGEAAGITLEGLYYPLTNGTLNSSFPLGVSNHFTGECASVSVKNGALLVMWEEPAAELVKSVSAR